MQRLCQEKVELFFRAKEVILGWSDLAAAKSGRFRGQIWPSRPLLAAIFS